VTPNELMERLSALRRAQIGGKRAPHEPLLLLWLFGRFAAIGSALVSYAEAADPVSQVMRLTMTPRHMVSNSEPTKASLLVPDERPPSGRI
jgi:hypothetical protein